MLRALVSRAFTPRSITNLESRIRELSCRLLEPLMGDGMLREYPEWLVLNPTRRSRLRWLSKDSL